MLVSFLFFSFFFSPQTQNINWIEITWSRVLTILCSSCKSLQKAVMLRMITQITFLLQQNNTKYIYSSTVPKYSCEVLAFFLFFLLIVLLYTSTPHFRVKCCTSYSTTLAEIVTSYFSNYLTYKTYIQKHVIRF